MEYQEDPTRRRVKQLFQYLQAFDQLKNPVVRHIASQHWYLWLRDLPDHEAVQYTPFSQAEHQGDGSAPLRGGPFSLTVRQPIMTRVPPPPPEIADWLEKGWDKPEGEATVIESRLMEDAGLGEDTLVNIPFDDDPERVKAFGLWRQRRAAWIQHEAPARAANRLFEHLYTMYSNLEREAERYELVLGNGILNRQYDAGTVDHPVLLKRLHVAFDPEQPAFIFTELDEDVELYTPLLYGLSDVDRRLIDALCTTHKEHQFHPLDSTDTVAFLERFITAVYDDGVYEGAGPLVGERNYPCLYNDPVLFVRSRVLGYAIGIDRFLQRIDEGGTVTPPLAALVNPVNHVWAEEVAVEAVEVSVHEESDPLQVLLTAPANEEQRHVIERLEKEDCVVVHGPPGTGKTHTIANLMGHLLARGSNVLVTSQSSKALSDIRNLLIEPLRPLCVRRIGTGVKSEEELMLAVQSIADQIQAEGIETIGAVIQRLTDARADLDRQLKQLHGSLRTSETVVHTDIVIEGKEYPLEKAVEWVEEYRSTYGWIPDAVPSGCACPLSSREVAELYQSNRVISSQYEREIELGLPDIDLLPSPDEFRTWVEDYKVLSSPSIQHGSAYWKHNDAHIEDLISTGRNLVQVLRRVDTSDPWVLDMVDAGREGGGRREVWMRLVAAIEEVVAYANTAEGHFVTFAPQLDPMRPNVEQLRILEAIVAHVKRKGKLGRMTLMAHRDWKSLLDGVLVERGKPQHIEEFVALKKMAALKAKRQRLMTLWDRMVVPLGGVPSTRLGDRPERALAQHVPLMRECLEWYVVVWKKLRAELEKSGFDWKRWIDDNPVSVHEYSIIHRIQIFSETFKDLLNAQIGRLTLSELREKITVLHATLDRATQASESQIAQQLYRSVQDGHEGWYETWYKRLAGVARASSIQKKRTPLLRRLAAVAPKWATAIEHRDAPHDAPTPPGDASKAWRWAQLHYEVEQRHLQAPADLQRSLEEVRQELDRVTQELVHRRAWAAQVFRMDREPEWRQALIEWQAVVLKMGMGDTSFQRKARELLSACKMAVPAWVMPLSQVVDTFDPRKDQFDVVIVDEASQVEAYGIIALGLAKKVVVLGDDQQIGPNVIAKHAETVRGLADEYLEALPNMQLYNGRNSLYDMAATQFGNLISFREHYRCAPEIIAFSNALAYDMRLRPMRDLSSLNMHPSVVGHRVANARLEKNVNRAEALELVSLLLAAIEQPEYKGKTFGIVAMFGDKQAAAIQSELRKRMPTAQFDGELRIRCGTPMHFQGDTRDIVFVSMVHAPAEATLPALSSDAYRQRFNVAASLASDQVWVIHSIDPEIDLKEGDLRKRFIEFALEQQVQYQPEQDPGETTTGSSVIGRIQRRASELRSAWSGSERLHSDSLPPFAREGVARVPAMDPAGGVYTS